MRSIGVFWKDQGNKSPEVNCYPCPYIIDDMALDLPKKQKSAPYKFELQINLWNIKVKDIPSGNETTFKAIDFGIVCPLTTQEIAFVFPFKIGKDDFQDLAKCLSENSDLLCTVFNEELKSESVPGRSYHAIECEKFKYLMYELSEENIIDDCYDEKTNTSILTFRINYTFAKDQIENCQLFVRFRLKLNDLKCFAVKKDVSNDWLQSAFSSTYMFDIRINDVRELSKKKLELEEYKGFSLPKFTKIHFFYMSDSEETIENGSSIKLDSRLLENERWHSYLGKNIEFTSSNVAHHWKKAIKEESKYQKVMNKKENVQYTFGNYQPTFDNFTLFFKTEFSEAKNKRIAYYIFIVLLLGIITSTIVSLVNSIKDYGIIFLIGLLITSSVIVYRCVFCKHVIR